MALQQIADAQVNPEIPINENNAALGQAFLWSHDVTADTGLTVGFNGGVFDANTVADATVACTDNTTNYVVAHRTTRALSTATATTNWNNTATYGRVARAVFAAGVLTLHDERSSVGGIFDHAAAIAGPVAAADVSVTDAGGYFTGGDVEAALQELGAAVATPPDAPDAVDVPIADAGGYYTATDVEGALQEAGAALSGLGTGDVVGPGSATDNHVALFDGASGKLIKDTGLTLSGTNTGDQSSVSGNAGTATALATPRTIGGVSFDGTADITQPFDIHTFYPGLPAASAKLYRGKVARALTAPANFAGAQFTGSANATASTVFDVQKNGVSCGSCTIAAGSLTPTFATTAGASVSFAAGDVFAVIAPATPDTTLADPAITFAFTR